MLKLLSQLKLNDTINISSMEIVPHNSWFTSTKRWLYGENRHRTLIEIENSIAETLFLLERKFNIQTYNELLSSLSGLNCLLLTYKGDEVSIFRILKCMKLIETYRVAVETSWNGDPSKLESIHITFKNIFQDRKTIREAARKSSSDSSDKWKLFTSSLISASTTLLKSEISKGSNQRKILKYMAPILLKKLLFPNIGDNIVFLMAFKLLFNHII
jgi:hypothetical protein